MHLDPGGFEESGEFALQIIPQMVTANVVGRWNAHAGSHADQPAHWHAGPPLAAFDARQYQGPATVLDLRGQLQGLAISREMLEAALSAAGLASDTP